MPTIRGTPRDKALAPLLDAAIAYATRAHAGQVDGAGEPYILHPLRVMGAVDTIEDKVVAVLHDVIEDCGGWAAFTLDLPADLTADLTSMNIYRRHLRGAGATGGRLVT
jgi:hypothetical protein